jgi:DNA-binding IclR family transcriptional regulator
MTARPATSAVDKALALVEAVSRSDRPLRLSELAGRVELHRATAYRVLAELVRRGWVLRDGDHYLPGAAVLQLSQLAARNSLVAVCRPVLTALSERTGLMTNLQVLEADGARVVDVVRPDRLAMISQLRGEVLPAHRFAGPLALVALLDDDARRPHLRLAEQAGRPVSGPDGLLADLDRARDRGYAVERGRHEKLVASISRAVASATGGPVCALTLVGPAAEFDPPHLDRLADALHSATDAVRAALTPEPVAG